MPTTPKTILSLAPAFFRPTSSAAINLRAYQAGRPAAPSAASDVRRKPRRERLPRFMVRIPSGRVRMTGRYLTTGGRKRELNAARPRLPDQLVKLELHPQRQPAGQHPFGQVPRVDRPEHRADQEREPASQVVPLDDADGPV